MIEYKNARFPLHYLQAFHESFIYEGPDLHDLGSIDLTHSQQVKLRNFSR